MGNIFYRAAFMSLISCFAVFSKHIQWTPERYNVSFDQAMRFSKHSRVGNKHWKRKVSSITKLCKKLYAQNNLTVLKPLDEPIIPKIVHLIWVGPKTPPPILQDCLDSIKEQLPDWECRLWTDENVKSLNLINRRYYNKEGNYGAKADLLRYELLYQFGGVYLDVDMVLLQPLDILHHTYEFYACVNPYDLESEINNCVIGSVPGHPILEYCIELAKKYRRSRKILKRTGPKLFSKSFFSVAPTLPDGRIIALPKSFFFPFTKKDMRLSTKVKDLLIRPETFGAHYWSATWYKKN